MKKRQYKVAMAATLTGMLLFVGGCKPTEKNYQAAYEAAVQKRQKDATDPDIFLPEGSMQQIGAPEKREINGHEIMFKVERLKKVQDDQNPIHRYNVAVSCYKMKTNCLGQVADLSEGGYDSYGGMAGEDKYYVFAGGFDTLDEAILFFEKFKAKHKTSYFVGLPSSPVIVEAR